MKTQKILESLVQWDAPMTKQYDTTAEAWACTCADCRNFLAAARGGLLPPEIRELLRELEIPPEKATYVCSLYPGEDGVLYQFSYRLAGVILRQADSPLGSCTHQAYPYGAPGFPEPHFDVDFVAELPWVPEEAEPS